MKKRINFLPGLIVFSILLFFTCGNLLAQTTQQLPNLDIPEIPGRWNLSAAEAQKLIEAQGFAAESNTKQKFVIVDTVAKNDPVYLAYMFENGKLKQAQKTVSFKAAGENEYNDITAAVEKAITEKFGGQTKVIVKNEKADGDLQKYQMKYMTDNAELAFLVYKWSSDGTLKVLITFNNPNLLSIPERWKLALDKLGFAEQQ